MADIGDGAYPPPTPRHGRVALITLIVAVVYDLLASIVLPAPWTYYEHQKGGLNALGK